MRTVSKTHTVPIPTAVDPEERNQQLINAAYDLAEKQLIEGTASSSVITHFLKLGSSLADLERVKIENENKLLEAKASALESASRTEELYAKAIEAMREYSGKSRPNENI